jgi:predicted enzyme involved in methoxymalonyl-ACP biosynthesis
MDETIFQKKLAELMGEISTLPKAERDKLTELATQTQARHQKLKKTVNDLQESLDYLRLSIKYLVFDLEATRRENGYLRRMIDQQHQQRHDTAGDGDVDDLDLPGTR